MGFKCLFFHFFRGGILSGNSVYFCIHLFTHLLSLFFRIESVCQQIQTQIPVLSNAEKVMRDELKTIQLQVGFLMNSLAQVMSLAFLVRDSRDIY